MALESIEKLREQVKRVANNSLIAEITVDVMESWCADIQEEVESKYMLLPVDADGVPIRVGDVVQFVNDVGGTGAKVEVCAVSNYYAYYGEGKHFYRAKNCRHVNPRTVEDVLWEYALEMNLTYETGEIGGEERAEALDDLTAKYAAELRGMMEVGDD